jgi:hypothetical protein
MNATVSCPAGLGSGVVSARTAVSRVGAAEVSVSLATPRSNSVSTAANS